MEVRRHSHGHSYLRGIVKHTARHAMKYASSYVHHHSKKRPNPIAQDHVERMKGDDIHSGFTDASYNVVVGDAKKNVDYSSGKNIYSEVNAGRCSSIAGSQNVQILCTIGSTSEWIVNSPTGSSHFGTAKIAVGLFNLNYAQYITGGIQYPDQAKRVATDKFHLSSCNLKVSLCNFTNIPVSSWVYVCEAKVHTSLPPNELWEKDLTLANVTGQWGAASNPGPGANAGGNPGYDTISMVNNTPGTCPNFNKIWKIKKVHRANLAAAAQEDIDFHIKMHQTGDMTKFAAMNPGITNNPATWIESNISVNYPRGSIAIMHVGRAGIIRDVTGGNDAVTYGLVSIGCVVTKTYNMYPMKAGSSRFDAKVVYPQVTYNVAEANTITMDITDEPAPAKSA